MSIKWLTFTTLAVLLLVQPIIGGKILGYFITPSRSHFVLHDALMHGLAARGHEVNKNLQYIYYNKLISIFGYR